MGSSWLITIKRVKEERLQGGEGQGQGDSIHVKELNKSGHQGRWLSEGPNNDSVYEFRPRVADSLQTALNDGIIYGPLTREELPWLEFKCSPMTLRLKPNGSDLIYPHGGKLGKGIVCSPNVGMENCLQFEPVTMAGDVQWRWSMYRAGKLAEFVKADWDMAYKHFSVCCEDQPLQVLEFVTNTLWRSVLRSVAGTAPHPTTYLPSCRRHLRRWMQSSTPSRTSCSLMTAARWTKWGRPDSGCIGLHTERWG